MIKDDTKGLLKSFHGLEERLHKIEVLTDHKFHDTSAGIHQIFHDINANIDQRFNATQGRLDGFVFGTTVIGLVSAAYMYWIYDRFSDKQRSREDGQ